MKFLRGVLTVVVLAVALMSILSTTAMANHYYPPPGFEQAGVGKVFSITALDTLWFTAEQAGCTNDFDGGATETATKLDWWIGNTIIQTETGELRREQTRMFPWVYVLTADSPFWYRAFGDAGSLSHSAGTMNRVYVDTCSHNLMDTRAGTETFANPVCWAVIVGSLDSMYVTPTTSDSMAVAVYPYQSPMPLLKTKSQ